MIHMISYVNLQTICFPGVQDKCFWSLDDLLQLDRPWYDQSARDNLSIDVRTFFVAGNMLLTDDDYTYCCL